MKAVILAGGAGTRLSEETSVRPKPMVEIGGLPILWHILKVYSSFGVNDFIICCGYKGYVIKEYFSNYFLHMSDVTFDMSNGSMQVHDHKAEPWKVTLVNTGENTLTGGRLRRVRPFLGDEDFCFTYGDGLADLDIGALIRFHQAHGREATMTAVRPPGRFGSVELLGDAVNRFVEKPLGDGGWINGGFFVLKPRVIDLIAHDMVTWESTPLETLAAADQLRAFKHDGFWQPMDTLRDKHQLESLWSSGQAPWKFWK
ncbi:MULTISPECIES: glucose-1-phosphate cytidylyltransferase [Ideonella]|uniref:Glucose-1-phosphate cytidylyltransferase n=1 Tax=Ideonella dechloratans TaxID=36863 RepID=A0A643F8W5_IDEDE|nr:MULTISPECIES: glucose-1-phosphate cytidylyltransferase [Ideonella]KAB0577387.1 glucose-1-phosphate cytidylyltransferase [Ideonella dechloratans]UFU09250.1 glucose-1-phosphate cytidylyltransferase [Ideonella dechloratans]